MEQKSLLFTAASQRTAYSEVPSQMAAYLRTGSQLKAGEIAGFEPRNAVLQSGVASNEPPLLPEPPLLLKPPLLPEPPLLPNYCNFTLIYKMPPTSLKKGS